MITVTLEGYRPDEVMTMVRELRSQGLVQGTDFDFKYQPMYYDDKTMEMKVRSTEFYFHTEKYATFFTIKYGK